MKNLFIYSLVFVFLPFLVIGQNTSNDSLKLDYSKIASYCIQTDIKPVLKLLEVDTNKLSKADIDFKMKFERRFKYSEDRDIVENQNITSIDSLVNIFKTYWRASLLDPDQAYDSILMAELESFFNIEPTSINDMVSLDTRLDSLDSYIQKFVSNEGYYALFGNVGRLRDLLIWQTQTDTTYTFSLHNEVISVPVIFLEDFITIGWTEYATINKSIGGWAGDDALYCVKKSYDIESDWFTIHYLAHEGRHYADYKIFPNLSGYDLEYRAKLTELSMAQETIYSLIKQFVSVANYDSDNQHPVANYVVIKNLSKRIFNSEFENDLTKWEAIDVSVLNKTAYELLNENTKVLHLIGSDIEYYIKKY